MSKIVNSIKTFFNTDSGKVIIYIFATVVAGLITNKVIEKTSKE